MVDFFFFFFLTSSLRSSFSPAFWCCFGLRMFVVLVYVVSITQDWCSVRQFPISTLISFTRNESPVESNTMLCKAVKKKESSNTFP